MKKYLVAALLLAGSVSAAEPALKVGIVNFGSVAADSKLGKNEQASFENLKKQMTSLIEDTEKQLKEISDKFNDKDFVDGLSPKGKEELEAKFQTLSQELGRYQQQFYQTMSQANYQVIQKIGAGINAASEKIASSKGLNMIVNKEACFYSIPSLDVTADIIKVMDTDFDAQAVKK